MNEIIGDDNKQPHHFFNVSHLDVLWLCEPQFQTIIIFFLSLQIKSIFYSLKDIKEYGHRSL